MKLRPKFTGKVIGASLAMSATFVAPIIASAEENADLTKEQDKTSETQEELVVEETKDTSIEKDQAEVTDPASLDADSENVGNVPEEVVESEQLTEEIFEEAPAENGDTEEQQPIVQDSKTGESEGAVEQPKNDNVDKPTQSPNTPRVAEQPKVVVPATPKNNVTDSLSNEEQSLNIQSSIPGLSTSSARVARVSVDNFRFSKTKKVYAFANKDIEVKDEANGKGKTVGKLSKDDVMFILADLGNGYLYVESGDVRGFVKAEDVIKGNDAKTILNNLKEKQNVDSSDKINFKDLLGEATVAWYDNKAFTFTRTTTKDIVIDKKYALANINNVQVLEEAKSGSKAVGRLTVKSLAYVIEEKDGWVYIESGSLRGFVKSSDIRFDKATQDEVKKNTEERYDEGLTTIDIDENKALYYSLKTTEKVSERKHTTSNYSNFKHNGQTSAGNTYPWGQCTWGVKELAPWVGNYWGNANMWLNSAASAGFETGSKPEVGAVAVFTGAGGGYGHVAVVTEINDDKVKIMESNYGGSAEVADSRGIGEYRGWIDPVSSGVTGYIYPNEKVEIKSVTNTEESEESTESSFAIKVPEKTGHIYTYMGWQTITAPDSIQYKLRQTAGMAFDDEGYGIIDGRYVVATTTTFGEVGDKIDLYLEDGTVIPAIIGDIKNQSDAGANMWGHQNGTNMVEFVVDQNSWYPSHSNPGTTGNHEEWSQYLEKVINNGNYFDN